MPEVLVKQSPLFNVHASVTISPGMTVAEIVEQCRFPEPVKPLVAVFIEDVELPREQWARIRPKPTTLIYVCVMPANSGSGGGKNPLLAIATLAIAVAAMAFGGPLGATLFNSVGASTLGATVIGTTTLAAITGSAVISLTGMLLLSALVKPPNSSGDGQSAPRFSVMGSSNRANPYGLIPRVFGKTRVYPQLAAQPYTETVGDDQYLRLLLLVGHGPLRITDLRIGDTPIANFQNVESQISEGGPTGWAGLTTITLYTNAVNQEDMSVLLEPSTFVTRTTSIEASEFSVDVVFPGGLFSSDNKGRRVTRTISFEAAWRVPGGAWNNIDRNDGRTTLSNAEWDRTEAEDGYVFQGYDENGNPVYTLSPSVTWLSGRFRVSGATSSAIRSGFRILLPSAGQYEVRIRRITSAGGNNDVDIAYLTAVRSVIYRSAINEPGLALIALRIKASQQLNGTPNQINCLAESYLPTWDPSTGWSWAITRNPAWIYTDLLRRRGQSTLIDDSRMDLATLRAWAIACDATAPNANEPRWTFDGVIDGGSVFDGLNRVASHGRASFVIREGKYSAVRDTGTGGIVQHITPRNSWGYSGRKQFIDQPHALRVRFANAAKNYQEDERIVFADGYNSENATRFETVELYGCTSSTMAWREGRYYLAIGQLRPEEHTVSMDVENLRANMGDLVMFAHDVIAVGLAQGRILSRVTGENLLLHSESFEPASGVWGYQHVSVTPNTAIAPDGLLTADSINVTGGDPILAQAVFITSSRTYTISVWLRGTGSSIGKRPYLFLIRDAYAEVLFSGSLPILTSDWQRYSFTGTFASFPSSYVLHRFDVVDDTPVSGDVVYAWGAQLEVGDQLTDYIKTTSQNVSRSITSLVLDETVIMEIGKQYGMRVRQQDGTAAQFSLFSTQGESNTVRLSTPASISTGPNSGDLFMFGELGSEATRMLIKRIEPGPDLTAVITMADAPDGVYTADVAQIPAFNSNITLQRLPEFEKPITPTFTVRSDETVLLRLSDGTLQDRIGVFPAPVVASIVPIDGYETQFKESSTTSWQVGPRSVQESPDIYITPVVAGIAYDIRIRAVSRSGIVGKWENVAEHVVIGKTTRPGTPASMSAVLEGDQVLLTWASVQDADLAEYEVRRGSVWETATLVDRARTTTLRVSITSIGTTTWQVKAIDSIGLYSINAASASYTLSGALAPSPTSSFSGDQVVLRWAEPFSPLSIDYYEVRHGASFAGGTSLGTIKGTTFSSKAQFSGTRRFWVAAVDVQGNVGSAGSVDSVVSVAVAPSVTTQVIDNNVLLFWNEVQGSLPTSTYEIRKGSTWEFGAVVGTKSGIFTTVFETVAGTYTYWIAAVDTAGNYGAAGSVATAVNQPPDYVLKLDNFSDFAGTKVNAATAGDGSFLLLVDTSETYEQHFTSRSWTTPQNQVDAGFPIFIQPTTTTGYYEEIVDTGAVLSGSKVTLTINGSVVSGSVTTTTRLSLSANGSTWTDYDNVSSVFGTGFRYVKYRVTATGTGNVSLYKILGINLRVDSKLINDAGNASCNSGDTGGTTVNFTVPFVDIVSIEVTPKGTTPVIAVYDFTDVPNPTSFKVLLFSTAGVRVSGDVSWSAKGY